MQACRIARASRQQAPARTAAVLCLAAWRSVTLGAVDATARHGKITKCPAELHVPID